jgi:hypothetical protein
MERGRRHIRFVHLCMLYTFTNMNWEQSLGTAHTHTHIILNTTFIICTNETDLLSVVILSLTAVIIALQPAHHKISMNNI